MFGMQMGEGQHTRPWARYVRLLCLGAWLTWICETMSLLVSSAFRSALASAFRRRPSTKLADLTGQRARVTPNCLPEIPSPSAPTQLQQNRDISNPSRILLKNSTIPRYPLQSPGRIPERTLSGPSDGAVVPPHRNSLLVLFDILQVGDGPRELHAAHSLGNLARVLERDTEEGTARLCRLGLVLGGGCVTDLLSNCRCQPPNNQSPTSTGFVYRVLAIQPPQNLEIRLPKPCSRTWNGNRVLRSQEWERRAAAEAEAEGRITDHRVWCCRQWILLRLFGLVVGRFWWMFACVFWDSPTVWCWARTVFLVYPKPWG